MITTIVWFVVDPWGQKCSFDYATKDEALVEAAKRGSQHIVLNDLREGEALTRNDLV